MGTEIICYILYVYRQSLVEPHLSYVTTGYGGLPLNALYLSVTTITEDD